MTQRVTPRRHRVHFRLVLMVSVVAAACGSGSGSESTADDVPVRPFVEVQDGEVVFEADPNDTGRAIFRVRTTEPMICAIVWGEDTAYGRFNNSQSMNGTGITDHDVALPDVEPGVEYHYIVQGTTADGTLYRSDDATFVIERGGGDNASAHAFERLGDNLATGAAIVEVSSTFSPAFAAEHAVDGDLDTEWSTSGDGDSGYLVIDLGAPTAIGAVEFVTRSMTDGSSVTETFTVAVDGGSPLGPFPASSPARPQPTTVDVRGQALRFDVATSTGGNVGAVEIGVYAPSG